MRGESGQGLARPAVPAAGICTLALAAAALDVRNTDWLLVGVAIAVAVVLVSAAALVPWSRLPAPALVLVPVACDLVLGVLRQAQGGAGSGYAPLAVLAVVWVGLALGRREVAAITICTALLFGVPILAIGAPLYPDTGWRSVALWTVVAAVVGAGANVMTNVQRRQTALADERARQLDRLLATQTAIASADVDLDLVLRTVAAEARRLTGADAVVVGLLDGDELVYRAVAGTAVPYLGLRLARDSAISGLAMQTQPVLVCTDSEHDARVDREACRRLGARSLVVVPLLHAGSALGVVKVYSAAVDSFRQEDARVLALLANIAASALMRAELIAKLSEQAVTDELTGLPNRRAWYEQLSLALGRCRRSGKALSLALLDLDDFKQVNDLRGHAAGDRVLRSVASHWSAVLRETDVLGRLGGDEFAVILEGADSSAAAEVVGRLEAALGEGQTATAGCATWDHVEDAAGLLARADADMYRRKPEKHRREHAKGAATT